MSLDEMKQAAKEIEMFKPIQSAVMNFFALKPWGESTAAFGDDMTPEHLARFLVSNQNQTATLHILYTRTPVT